MATRAKENLSRWYEKNRKLNLLRGKKEKIMETTAAPV